jgi:hypothetical protein
MNPIGFWVMGSFNIPRIEIWAINPLAIIWTNDVFAKIPEKKSKNKKTVDTLKNMPIIINNKLVESSAVIITLSKQTEKSVAIKINIICTIDMLGTDLAPLSCCVVKAKRKDTQRRIIPMMTRNPGSSAKN